MASSLWPSVASATARQKAIDTTANNLANMNTDSFKKDEPTFKEYLIPLERTKTQVDIPRGPIKDAELYPLDGKDQSYVVVDGVHTDFHQGNLKVTQSPLDVALEGEGFFEVSTPQGVRYTRAGAFKLNAEGFLVDTNGNPVLAANPGGLATAQPVPVVQSSQGRPLTQGGVGTEQPQPIPAEIQARMINLSDYPPGISITQTGGIYSGDNQIAKLSLVEFNNPGLLMKDGQLLYRNREPANVSTDPPRTRVLQGMIETSNVNPIEEMTRLIENHRLFETDLKAIKTMDEMLSKEVNEVGKI